VVLLSSIDLDVNRRVWSPRWPNPPPTTRAPLHHFYRHDRHLSRISYEDRDAAAL